MPEEHSEFTNLRLEAVEADKTEKEGPLDGPLSPEQIALVQVIQRRFSHSGPLPSPETLAAYEKVLPGAAERIVRMAETQSSHRHKMESAVILGNVRAQSLGMWFAFLLALAGILGGLYLALHGHSLTGFGTLFFSLAALVGTFVLGKREQRKELQEKQSLDSNDES